MAYQTGTASSTADLLDKIRIFLAAQGWTIEAWRFMISQPTYRWLAVSKAGFFFNAYEWLQGASATYSNVPHNIYLNYATSYNSGLEVTAQAPDHGEALCTGITPPYAAYHFFEGAGASGPYFHCALELGAGEFRHFGFGVLNKAGTYTGGEFVYGLAWNLHSNYVSAPTAIGHSLPFDDNGVLSAPIIGPATVVRCVEAAGGGRLYGYRDPGAGLRLKCGGIAARAPGGQSSQTPGAPQYQLWANGPFTQIGLAPLMRAHCFADRGSNLFSLIGEPPAFRHVDMTYLNPGDEIVLGADTWKVFPMVRKGTASAGTIPVSGNYGIAYLKA